MLRGLLLLLLAALVAPASAAAQLSFPGEQRVTGPELVASVDAALAYWESEHRTLDCPRGIDTWIADLPPSADGAHAAGMAWLPGCKLWLDRAWVTALTDPLALCKVVAHEVGHLTGLADGGTGNAVMDSPDSDAIPATPQCLAAFPPPPPVPATPVPAVAPPPVTLAPVANDRLTLAELRAAARRVLRSARIPRARPVACRLSGSRRGSCRVSARGRRCTGRVIVSSSPAGGETGLFDARCRITGR